MSEYSIIQQGYEEDAIKEDEIDFNDGKKYEGYHLSVLQRIELQLLGSTKIGYKRQHGWKKELPIYLFRCPNHGLKLSYESGYGSMLLCPECLRAMSSK